ncbi:MAG: preprotein translocase subunit YajC [Rhodospirillaceae bacterium]
MWISPAFAQAAGAAGQPNAFMSFLPLLLIFVVFYFLLIRPQQKKLKEHRAMLTALRRGDRIVTNGGIIGLVTKVEDRELIVEIADGVRVHVARDMVASVVSKTEPVGDKADGDKKDEK